MLSWDAAIQHRDFRGTDGDGETWTPLQRSLKCPDPASDCASNRFTLQPTSAVARCPRVPRLRRAPLPAPARKVVSRFVAGTSGGEDARQRVEAHPGDRGPCVMAALRASGSASSMRLSSNSSQARLFSVSAASGSSSRAFRKASSAASRRPARISALPRFVQARRVGSPVQDLAVGLCGQRVLAFFFELHRGAERSGVGSAGGSGWPRAPSSSTPARGAPSSSSEPSRRRTACDRDCAAGQAVDDDVVEKVERLSRGLNDLQHEDDRPAVANSASTRPASPVTRLGVEARSPCGEDEIDGHHPAAGLRQRRLPFDPSTSGRRSAGAPPRARRRRRTGCPTSAWGRSR